MSPSNELNGRVAIVTGASRGIGVALASALSQAGADVAMVSRAKSAGALRAVARTIAEASGRAPLVVEADVIVPEDCERAIAAVVGRFGALHAVFNNAGLGMNLVGPNFRTYTRSTDIAPEIWRAMLQTNVDGPYNVIRAAIGHLEKSGSGRIVNVSTSAATLVRPGFAPYGPSKAALDALTSIWAKEFAASDVTVNALIPGGATDTDMIMREDVADRATLLRPEIMGPPAVWLASLASRGVTGKKLVAKEWLASANPVDAVSTRFADVFPVG